MMNISLIPVAREIMILDLETISKINFIGLAIAILYLFMICLSIQSANNRNINT